MGENGKPVPAVGAVPVQTISDLLLTVFILCELFLTISKFLAAVLKFLLPFCKLFSAICGENFTNGEVVFTHLGLVAFFMVLGVVGGWE
jgi:hypothetical protein